MNKREKRECATHGLVDHIFEKDGHVRCYKCRSDAVSKRRKMLKQILVAESGGKCQRCGYDKYIGALDFHHKDEKTFGISRRGLTRSLTRLREEIKKCILVCANCHREIHGGF